VPTDGSDRASLGFREQVRTTFAFLEARYGFAVVDSSDTLIRYVSRRLCVDVYHGRRSYELGLDIARRDLLGRTGRSYSMADIVGLTDERRAWAYRDYTAVSRQNVAKGLRLLADDLLRCGSSALTGDAGVFRRMRDRSQARAARWSEEMTIAQTRERASAAWQRRDYERVAALYASMHRHLSPAESAKLRYARRLSSR
jgi:hypothetical protein